MFALLREAQGGWDMGFAGTGDRRRLQRKAGAPVRNLNLNFWTMGALEGGERPDLMIPLSKQSSEDRSCALV